MPGLENGFAARVGRLEQDMRDVLRNSREWDRNSQDFKYLADTVRGLAEEIRGMRRWAIGAVVSFAIAAITSIAAVAMLVTP